MPFKIPTHDDVWRAMYDSIPKPEHAYSGMDRGTDPRRYANAKQAFDGYLITTIARNARIAFGSFRASTGKSVAATTITMYECSSCGTFRAQGVCRCYCLS